MLQAVTPAPMAMVQLTHAAADAEAAAPAAAASDAASTKAGEEELQSASTAIKEAMSSLLTKVHQDSILMSHASVSNVRESVLLPSVAGSTHADGNSADLVSGMIVEQPAMTKDESESVMCGEVDTILDDLTSTAGIAVPVQSANSSTPDAAVDTDSIVDRLLIDVGGTEHESQHAEQSHVLFVAEGDKVVNDAPIPIGGSSPDAMVNAAADTDSLTDRLVADTAAAADSLIEQQAGLPMALEVDTDSVPDRLLTEVSMDDAKSTQQEEEGSSEADDVDDLLDDLVITAAVPLPAHSEMDPVSTSEAKTEAEIANAEPEVASAEPEPMSAEPRAMSTEAERETGVRLESIAAAAVLTPEDSHAALAITEDSDITMTKEVNSVLDEMTNTAGASVPLGMRLDGSDRSEQVENESVLEGLLADVAEVPQYLPSSGEPFAVWILLLASCALDLLVHSDLSS